MKKSLLATLLCCILSWSGCWTTLSVWGCLSEDAPPEVYGGVRTWFGVITHYDTAAILGLITIVDVPTSFALDTILFPVTLPWNIIYYANICQ